MTQPKKENRGGSRIGSGRPKKADKEKKKAYSVQLTEAERDEIVKDHGSLTKAVKSLLHPR